MALLLLLPLLGGCPEEQVVTTTRNLNRPGPLAMVCAARVGDGGLTTGLSPSACTPDAGTGGGEAGPGKGTLFGFVANTARGEVAVFRSNASGEPLVDLDRRSPGYGFLPVGALPTDLKASGDGCRVVSANAGSCDLSVIDVPAVLRFASGELQSPSGAAVSRVIPRTAAGAPLRSQPHELLLVPASVSAKAPGEACPAAGAYRAYVSFPRCNLIAEIDLRSGTILHGMQVRADGFVLTENPVCPVDCILPGEIRRVDAGGPRRETGTIDARLGDGPRPDGPRDAGAPPDLPEAAPLPDASALDSAPPADILPPEAAATDAAPPGDGGGIGVVSPLGPLPSGLALTDKGDRLYISSAGAGFISVIDINLVTGAFENPRRILLAGRPSQTRLRLSPATLTMGRFLYAVASDRSVRVVSTDLERECETELDLLALPAGDAGVPLAQARCYPVGAPTTPPRRVNATGHGLTFGSSIPQDVVFVQSLAGVPDAGFPSGPTGTPLRGVYALVVTSDGSTYVIDVEDWNFVQQNSTALPRLHLPHRFRNELQGTTQATPDAGVSSVSGGGSGGVPVVVSKVREPGAGATVPSLPGEGVFLRAVGAPVVTPWQLVYEERLVARWAGDLKVGRDSIALNDPGVDFCAADVKGTIEENGRKVRHGDIAVLVGCKDDTECGLEQSCVKPVAEQVEFGLCLDKSRSDELFGICTPFLRGSREYLVRRATPDTLVLDVLPVEPQRVIKQSTQPAGGCKSNADCDPYYLCAIDDQIVGEGSARNLRRGECFRPGCASDADCFRDTTGNVCVQPLDGSPRVCSSVPLPLEEGGACQNDNDCRPRKPAGAACETSRGCDDPGLECRKPSTASENKICVDKGMVCAQFPGLKNRCVRKSPCFIELQRYDVRAGRSFLVGSYRRGSTDPATRECRDDPAKSPLLGGRVPVGLPVYPVLLGPVCTGPTPPVGVPEPNPCFERTESGYEGYTLRTSGGSMTYSVNGPATVVRFANPDLWFSLGLSHLTALPSAQGRPDGGVAVPLYAPMPERGLTIELDLHSGFSRQRAPTAGHLSLPTRLEDAPDGFVYIVDTGDLSGSTGTRGQVVRIDRATLAIDSLVVR